MMQLLKQILANKKHLPFEGFIMNVFLLMGILMSILTVIIDLSAGKSVLLDCFLVLCWIVTFFLLEKYDFAIIVAFIMLIFILLTTGWMESEGILGVMPYYAIIFITIIGMVTRRITRILLVGSIIGVEIVMTYVDYSRMSGVDKSVIIDRISNLLVVSVMMAALIIFYSVTYAKEKAKNLSYSKVIEKQSNQQLYYLQHLEDINMKLRAERHDFNNHIGVIYGLMDGCEYDKVMDYTTELVNNAEHYRKIISIPYPTIQAIINYKLSVARNEGIEVDINADLPASLELNEFDIGILLGNLMDNAVDALRQLDTLSRSMTISLSYKQGYLVIYMENSYQGKLKTKGKAYISSKEDPDNHGFGLKNVRNIVDEYAGIMKINDEDQQFKVDIALWVNTD